MALSVEQLQEVARARDSGRRRELLGAIAEMFLAGDAKKSNRESTLFSDIFLKTIHDLDVDGRSEVSNQLAGSAQTPKDIAVHLAKDEDWSIADPILRLSPVLDDEDLILIAKEMTNERLVSISQRQTLSENVTDALIDNGDEIVMRCVSANDGAQISRDGFSTLVKRAGDDKEVQHNLAGRLDMPDDLVRRVLPKLTDDVAQRIKHAFNSATDKNTIENAISRATVAFAGARLKSSKARVQALVFATDVKAGKRNIDDVVKMLAGEDKFLEMVTILARLADLPDDMAGDLMFKTESAPFLIMCRSVGMSRDAFGILSGLRCKRLKLPSSHSSHAITEFDAITEHMANRFIRFVNLRMTCHTD